MTETSNKNEIIFCKNDLSDNLYQKYKSSEYLAVDTEAMGLVHGRDRLCLIQICNEFKLTSCIKIDKNICNSPNLKSLFENKNILKIFHFARFDVAALKSNLTINTQNIYCTKIASKIARTYTSNHGLKDLIYEMLGVELDKTSQSSDWGNEDNLSEEQINYAANDVRYLIDAMKKLNLILKREGRYELAQRCFEAISVHSELDINHYSSIFEH